MTSQNLEDLTSANLAAKLRCMQDSIVRLRETGHVVEEWRFHMAMFSKARLSNLYPALRPCLRILEC